MSGFGPQRDADALAVWEWPESVGHAPAPAIRLSGALFPVTRGWRNALANATRWRGFSPAALLAPRETVFDEMCRWECTLRGVGLIPVEALSSQRGEPTGSPIPAEPGRRASARRRTADRWIEETLYEQVLDLGLYPGQT